MKLSLNQVRNGSIFILLLLTLIVVGQKNIIVYAANPWMNPSQAPSDRADELLASMTQAEKLIMVHGVSGTYTGNVPAISRLGIPALGLSDGPAGVGNGMTNVTAFPVPITVAASWDVNLMQQYGTNLGAEQRGKGTNVHLAPMMNLIRVPRAGRNWEGYSEDPYLSEEMAYYEVLGIQSNGIIATAKHYIDNEQETNRNSYSVTVDDRTQHEIYMAPFRGAVQAGVGAIMCAYNRVGGSYACEYGPTQNTILKGQLGFPGWIMSDWGATHSTVGSANGGLDMEMPGSTYFGTALSSAISSGTVSQSRLNDMVRRILTSMFAAGLFDRPPDGSRTANVRSTAHTTFARNAGAQSMVLLKNTNNALPLTSSVTRIAVIGSRASTSPVVGGGGSGSVNGGTTVTALSGITSRAGGGVTITYTDGSNTTTAANNASNADVAIVVVGLNSTEGSDRANLSLPSGNDTLITTVAAANPRTIVIVYSPAQVLMPWANNSSVGAILWGGLPGEQQGNALADVLYGDVNPSGKMPFTFATNSTYAADVSSSSTINYSEGLNIGYRYFDTNNITPLYAFGHGLSYTTFTYSNLSTSVSGNNATVSVEVTNSGSRAGAEVAQLYLGFPSSAGEPPQVLRGFRKITLAAGATQTVTFNLTPEELSYWNTSSASWVVPSGSFTARVGSSSRDIRLTGSFTVSGGGVTTTPTRTATRTNTATSITNTFTRTPTVTGTTTQVTSTFTSTGTRTNTPTTTGTGGITWTQCASENGTCTVPSTMVVRYGANNSWYYRVVTGSIACNNSTWGDPINGTAKACYYSPDGPTPTGGTGVTNTRTPTRTRTNTRTTTGTGGITWTQCASENGTCTFTGTMTVRYGAGSSWYYRVATGSIACNNATFGDPIVGTAKACYYSPNGPTPTP